MIADDISNVFEPLAAAFRQVTMVAEVAARTFQAFAKALIEIDAPVKAGEWPDYFSLLNRYMRTDTMPVRLTGERWES